MQISYVSIASLAEVKHQPITAIYLMAITQWFLNSMTSMTSLRQSPTARHAPVCGHLRAICATRLPTQFEEPVFSHAGPAITWNPLPVNIRAKTSRRTVNYLKKQLPKLTFLSRVFYLTMFLSVPFF